MKFDNVTAIGLIVSIIVIVLAGVLLHPSGRISQLTAGIATPKMSAKSNETIITLFAINFKTEIYSHEIESFSYGGETIHIRLTDGRHITFNGNWKIERAARR